MNTQQRPNRGRKAPNSSPTPKYGDGKYRHLVEDPRSQDPETKGVSRRGVIGAAALVFGAVAGFAAMQSKDNHDQYSSAEHQPTPEEQATQLVDAYSAYLSQREAYEAGKTTEEPQLPANLDGIATLAVEAGDSIGTVVDRHIATLAEADAFHTKPEQDGVTNATSARVAELYLTDGELQPGDIVTLAQYQGFVVPLTINSHEPSSGVPQHTLEP
ncbi:hypothetical protein HG437_002235 [Candidatus Saccharibacteria bacterium]|nr:hypothetical protein [Candidatus Saccharibacteria bacterium]